MQDLNLGSYGLQWCRSADVLAHALEDGRVAVLRGSVTDTAAGLNESAPGDGAAWMEMFEHWLRIRDPFLDALFTPFPPVVAATTLLRRLRTTGAVDFARLGVTPVRRLAQERFDGDGAALLLTGNAMHSDLPPDSAGSGLFGWLLAMLGQDVGFPAPSSLSQPVPWSAPGARYAGTVHLGVDVDGFVDFSADLSTGRVPRNPFILLGQMTDCGRLLVIAFALMALGTRFLSARWGSVDERVLPASAPSRVAGDLNIRTAKQLPVLASTGALPNRYLWNDSRLRFQALPFL